MLLVYTFCVIHVLGLSWPTPSLFAHRFGRHLVAVRCKPGGWGRDRLLRLSCGATGASLTSLWSLHAVSAMNPRGLFFARVGFWKATRSVSWSWTSKSIAWSLICCKRISLPLQDPLQLRKTLGTGRTRKAGCVTHGMLEGLSDSLIAWNGF